MNGSLWNTADCAKYLVSCGADVNAKDYSGITSLMRACEVNNKDTVTFLISQGADVNAKQRNGSTALSLAQHYPDIVAILTAAGAK